MRQHIKVKGQRDFARDRAGGFIVNVNKDNYTASLKRRKMARRIDELEASLEAHKEALATTQAELTRATTILDRVAEKLGGE